MTWKLYEKKIIHIIHDVYDENSHISTLSRLLGY